jgi:hypothetical protein
MAVTIKSISMVRVFGQYILYVVILEKEGRKETG